MKKIIFSLMMVLLFTVGCGANEEPINNVDKAEGVSAESSAEESDSEGQTEEASTEGATASEEVTTDEVSNEEEMKEEDTEDTAEEPADESNDDELQDYIDIELTDIDGNIVRVSDYEGKFIVLNFFGVWCHYCMEEMPDLEKVYSEYEGDDFVILLVNATTTEKIGQQGVIDWYNEGLTIDGESVPITMPMAMDLDGSALEVYPVSGFPTSYFINKSGKVIGAVPGMLDEATMLSILDQYNN